MMFKLQETDYDRASPLFQTMDHHLAVRAILEGAVPATIYVDHLTRPQAAFTWTKHRFFLAGTESNEAFNQAIGQFFAETIYPQAREAGLEVFVLYYAPDGWEQQMGMILKDKLPLKAQRQFYACRKPRAEWRTLWPEGFVLRFVDETLLEDRHLKNLDLLREEMCSERQSVRDFLDKSFGVYAIYGDEIAGWCLSEYNSGDRCEVGIETLGPYQRCGLATALASALVEHALSRGALSQIGWHCYASNVASIATAVKVGFEKVQDYPVFLA